MKLPLDSQSLVVMKVARASFKWDSKKEKSTLNNINIVVSKGFFAIVVGKVGAGKSSFDCFLTWKNTQIEWHGIFLTLKIT
jgi:ABC-type uncharacterized transport system ATPase component